MSKLLRLRKIIKIVLRQDFFNFKHVKFFAGLEPLFQLRYKFKVIHFIILLHTFLIYLNYSSLVNIPYSGICFDG